ncbi:MAG TPA: M61 family peptidase [Silvibacterium sp.]|nr:M61 family peptidase [Silvibacterium sp.]
MFHPAHLRSLILPIATILATYASAQAPSQPILITADLTDAPRKLIHADIEMPVSPGPVTLTAAKWIPGTHRPSGPIDNFTGLVVRAAGQEIPWRRDDVDLYAFHIDVPQGVTKLDIHVDFLAVPGSTVSSDDGSTSGLQTTMEWEEVALYPAATPVRDIPVIPSVKLPAGWKLGTALTPSSADGDTTHFARTTIEMLIDSPVIAGKYFREIPLAPDVTPKHYLDVAADAPEDLDLKPAMLDSLSKLVREAGSMYASRHYSSYHFLLGLSDTEEGNGLEHHQSSDNRTPEHAFSDESLAPLVGDLLPHEYTHSWNGKYRRPIGLATPDYATPMKGRLLWVYEGMTQYLGEVLAVRSGFTTPEQFREAFAYSAASLDVKPGRTWRDLEDTAVSSSILRGGSREWSNWRRGQDYYQEGALIWLDVDTTIRKLTGGKKSLNDFCALFLGKGGNTPSEVVPYDFDEIVATLNQIAPNDWAGFLRDRLTSKAPHAPLEGITQSGYELSYSDKSTAYERAIFGRSHAVDVNFSIGLVAQPDGTLSDVLFGSPAFKAGLGPAEKIIAVNGRAFSGPVLALALKSAKGTTQPIDLIVENTGYFRTVHLDYHDGEKFPMLKRVDSSPDVLADILKPLAK